MSFFFTDETIKLIYKAITKQFKQLIVDVEVDSVNVNEGDGDQSSRGMLS